MNTTIHVQLENLFLLHYKEWCFLSYSYLKNKEESEEVVQDVCAKILVRKQLDEISSLKSYIIVAIKNSCLKKLKKQQKFISLSENEFVFSSSLDDSSVVEERTAMLHKALEQLPQPSKNIFMRCVMEGEKYQFVADSMDISINTVKYHIKTAYKKMRLEMVEISVLVLLMFKIFWK
ncbi:sigma-70 family RNA polymerase sigma factor [Flavobacterium sp.]|uniref:sigma-70 family RNA polymerase sigma factor n=1 Tax=Flavobacterium sp. TaxID=239 RepID=UPI003C342F78